MDNTHHLEIKKKKFLDGSAVMFPVSYTHQSCSILEDDLLIS